MSAAVWPYSGTMDILNTVKLLSSAGASVTDDVEYFGAAAIPGVAAGYVFYRYCDPVMSQSWQTLAIGYGIGAAVYLGGNVLMAKLAGVGGKSTNSVYN